MKTLVLCDPDNAKFVKSNRHHVTLHSHAISFLNQFHAERDTIENVVIDSSVIWMHAERPEVVARIPANLFPPRLEGESDNRYYCAMAHGWSRFGRALVEYLVNAGWPIEKIIIWGCVVATGTSLYGVPAKNCFQLGSDFDLSKVLDTWRASL